MRYWISKLWCHQKWYPSPNVGSEEQYWIPKTFFFEFFIQNRKVSNPSKSDLTGTSPIYGRRMFVPLIEVKVQRRFRWNNYREHQTHPIITSVEKRFCYEGKYSSRDSFNRWISHHYWFSPTTSWKSLFARRPRPCQSLPVSQKRWHFRIDKINHVSILMTDSTWPKIILLSNDWTGEMTMDGQARSPGVM